jgi:hypothetical protein
MKWYKKQVDAILKKTEKKKPAEKKTDADKKAYLDAGKGRKNTFSSSSPVAQRNINRPKTDLY